MKKHIQSSLWFMAMACFVAFPPQPVLATTPAQVFEKVKDSVVSVRTMDAEGNVRNQGSGVIVAPGRIATSCQVLDGGTVYMAGRSRLMTPAVLFAEDGDRDICLLTAGKVDGRPAVLGKAGKLGTWSSVYAVGVPLGSLPSFSTGEILRRWGGFTQTTAVVSPGMEGGGLFDGEGSLVGLLTLYKQGEQSFNFAMPAEWIGEVKPGPNPAGGRRGETQWLKHSIYLEKSGDWDGLYAWGADWSKALPASADAHYFQGIASCGLKNYNEAEEAFSRAAGMEPANSTYWYNLGVTYNALNRHHEAVDSYREAVRLEPGMTEALISLGVTYTLTGNPSAAMDTARELRRVDPFNADILLKMINTRR